MITGQNVGPHVGYCEWKYANHGYPIECGRNDEVVAGKTFTENWDSKAPSVGTILAYLETTA